jgi:hypothetical protein
MQHQQKHLLQPLRHHQLQHLLKPRHLLWFLYKFQKALSMSLKSSRRLATLRSSPAL